MNLTFTSDKELIRRLTEIVEKNLDNENFGVDELVQQAGLSHHFVRSRIKKAHQKTISQFVNEIRLHRAMDLLKQGTVTASEAAYQVGFGSPSYFSTCFHALYGFPPGEVKRRTLGEDDTSNADRISPELVQEKGADDLVLRKKNKKREIVTAVVFIVLIMIISFLTYKTFLSSPKEKSIAVLPFDNLSKDKENQYFADGVMKEILLNLSYIKDLKVISFTSTEQFRGSAKSIPEIAKMLHVNFILLGSVQRYGERVKVIVEFIDARKDRYILSLPYDRDLTDIFNIQSDIARQVAGRLQATLSEKEIMQINKIPTRKMDAYKHYQMGRFFWNRRNKTDQLHSIEYFEKALEIDPDYALAISGLADAYFILTFYGWYPAPEGFAKAKDLALRALKLDNSLAEAHATLGDVLCWGEWKWEEARKELELAVEQNPNYATGYQYYSELLDILGDRAGARKYISLALDLNPFSYAPNACDAIYYYNEGRYRESLEAHRKALSIEPEKTRIYLSNFIIYSKLGDDLHAIEELKKFLASDSIMTKYLDKVKDVYNRNGLNGLLILSIEADLETKNPNSLVIAQRYALLNKKEEALYWLENAFKQKQSTVPRMNSNPDFKNLHSEPRYKALKNKMGL